MRKIYLFVVAVIAVTSIYAQCNIDTTRLTAPGFYPTANHLPHIVKDSLYDQTVQGLIQGTIDTVVGGVVSVHMEVDSVRLDSIAGLPNGITWVKNPNVLLGGHYGCVEFTGITSDSAGQYNLTAYGTTWVHLKVPLLGTDSNVVQTGPLNRYPPFNRYFLVVDSAQLPLTVQANVRNNCFGNQNGSITLRVSGGSPVAPYSYLWSNGSTAYNLNGLDSGTYTITVTSGNETVTQTFNIVTAASPVTASVTGTGSTGNDGTASVTASGGVPPYSYRWNNGQRVPSIDSLPPGLYTVRVTDSFGCTAIDTFRVQNLASGITVVEDGLPQITLFPNPANSVLNLQIESQKQTILKAEIIDMTGRCVYSSQFNVAGHYSQAISLDQLTAGIYILRLSSSDNKYVHQRFVVSH
jgi:hypothetical protein